MSVSSPLETIFRDGKFHLIIPEIRSQIDARQSTSASCSAAARFTTTCSKRARVQGIDDVAIIRIEQLVPVPDRLSSQHRSARTRTLTDIVWCQEEPQNQGAWYQIQTSPAGAPADDQQQLVLRWTTGRSSAGIRYFQSTCSTTTGTGRSRPRTSGPRSARRSKSEPNPTEN